MKKKILIFLLVFIIALMPVVSSALAIPSHIQMEIDNHVHHVILRDRDESSYILLVGNDVENWKFNIKDFAYSASFDARNYKFYKTSDNGLTWEGSGEYTSVGGGGFNGLHYFVGPEELIVETTFDMKNYNGEVFFSPPRPPIPVLVETMGAVDSGMILKTILGGLTLLVGFLVLAICLRKGWAFLRRQLTT